MSELLPLINVLELRGRSSHVPGRAISVETQLRWGEEGIEAPAILLRELGVELIEEGISSFPGSSTRTPGTASGRMGDRRPFLSRSSPIKKGEDHR